MPVIAHISQPGPETSNGFPGDSNYREISMCSQRLDGDLLVHLALNCRVESRLHGRFLKACKRSLTAPGRGRRRTSGGRNGDPGNDHRGSSPKRAQGRGIRRVDDRQVFAAIVFVLTTGCAWRHLPPTFGVSHQTAHRRFGEWSEAALWAKLHRAVLDRLGREARSTGRGRSSIQRACVGLPRRVDDLGRDGVAMTSVFHGEALPLGVPWRAQHGSRPIWCSKLLRLH